MWAPLAAELARDHTVVVPDLRGMGLSSHPAGGYDKKTQGAGRRARARRAEDRASRPSSRTTSATWSPTRSPRSIPTGSTRWVVMDAPLPGIGPWDEILQNPLLWHFRFGGPDMERLVAGPRAHLSRPLLERVLGRSRSDRRGDARSTMRRSMRGRAPCIRRSRSSPPSIRTRIDNQAFAAQGKLDDAGAGDRRREVLRARRMADVMRVRRHRRHRRRSIADSGHWLMEEQPAATMAAITAFLATPPSGG